jgi:hypothetical protein
MKTEDIERYVNNELTGEELKSFELALENNVQLREEVAQMFLLVKRLKDKGLSNKISLEQRRLRQYRKIRIILYAATVILGLLLVFLLKNSKQEIQYPMEGHQFPADSNQMKIIPLEDSLSPEILIPVNESDSTSVNKSSPPIAQIKNKEFGGNSMDLAMEFYFEPRDIVYVRGQGALSGLDSAKLAFNNEDYNKCLEILSKLSLNKPYIDFFKANIYFKLEQYNRANILYSLCLSMEKDQFKKEEIEWYLLLNNMACGPKCKPSSSHLLKLILSNEDHSYFKNASNLQKSLLNR